MTSIRSFTFCALLALLLVVLTALPPYAQAQNAGDQALVIIRFNQPRVYFDQQLYGAISKAVAVKPDVVFDVVSYAPMTGNPDVDKKWQATAGHNTRAVVSAMKDMGVPAERIHATGEAQSGIRYDETHVFVR